ncbi:hypothetical protein TeGR_g1278 [Tetraparma gracilis]|uniref:Methyltransferase domain-containing protein n=1 Tax=Tetraparma gracilis TaxID=2962635 RepID=A0ABQ6MQR9_9STRA|nr:hypothetical protein TeGR_g1278 [Tetraparma gracilis]
MRLPQTLLLLLLISALSRPAAPLPLLPRRSLLPFLLTSALPPQPFSSSGTPLLELTQTTAASRDTNISPLEYYDTLRELARVPPGSPPLSALDVGCGAGVSTELLSELSYSSVTALDWSRAAWDSYARPSPNVTFYEYDDERFFRNFPSSRFDLIVFNFAVNEAKALSAARDHLTPSGRLLAPVNLRADYWLSQQLRLYERSGALLYNASRVGAWDVLFQPDVTQDTCQGIWCKAFNGWERKP